jgi:adenylate kinase family enzyme
MWYTQSRAWKDCLQKDPCHGAAQQSHQQGACKTVKRILVLGSSGAGKSTFARELETRLGIETIHLDSHYWQPNWVSTPPEAWDEKLKKLLERDSWVMDGNYPASLPLRMEYADTVVFLDRGRLLSLLRCVSRFLRYRGQSRPELAPGCYEKIDWDFLKWIWHYPRDVKPGIMKALENQSETTVIVLRADGQVARFLAEQETV